MPRYLAKKNIFLKNHILKLVLALKAMTVILGFMSDFFGEIILKLAAVDSSFVIYVNILMILNLFILSWMDGFYFLSLCKLFIFHHFK